MPDPTCPLCGKPMQRRRNRVDRGAFWGCSDFPGCRGTRQIGQEFDEPDADDACLSLDERNARREEPFE